MQKILAFAGTKSSGKNSAANFVSGYLLAQAKRKDQKLPLPNTFTIDEKGKLIVEAAFTNAEGKVELQPAELDLKNHGEKFMEFAYNFIWPYAKIYSFADTLKEFCIRIFGLNGSFIFLYNRQKIKNLKEVSHEKVTYWSCGSSLGRECFRPA